MGRLLTIALAMMLVASASMAALVINEVGAPGPGTDNAEFVELYDGGALTPLANLQLRLINGANGAAYDTIDLTAGGTITNMPADGYLVISANAATVPNTDIDDGPDTNWLQNGDPDALQIFDSLGSTVIDSVAYFTQYDTTPGTPENGLLASSGALQAYEGAGGTGEGGSDDVATQTGTSPIVARTLITLGRFPDGADTNDNKVDFVNLYGGRSPGASNNSGYSALPLTESVTGLSLALEWSPTWAVIVSRETAATAAPAGIPPSPDAASPTEWASIKDNTGGGHQAIVTNFLAQDYNVSAFLYCGAIGTTGSPEVGAIVARMNGAAHDNNSNGFYDNTTPLGTYGNSFYALEVDYETGIATAVSALNSVRTDLASSAPLSTGWHEFAIRCEGGIVEYAIDGVRLHLLSGETPRVGYAGVGYIESDPVGTGSVRNNFDGFTISAAGAVPVELSTFASE